MSSVHPNRFRSQDGTSHTLVGTVASGPLQSKPSPRRGKRVAPQLTNARDEVGRMEAWGGTMLLCLQEKHTTRF